MMSQRFVYYTTGTISLWKKQIPPPPPQQRLIRRTSSTGSLVQSWWTIVDVPINTAITSTTKRTAATLGPTTTTTTTRIGISPHIYYHHHSTTTVAAATFNRRRRPCRWLLLFNRSPTTIIHHQHRCHYTYPNGPGHYGDDSNNNNNNNSSPSPVTKEEESSSPHTQQQQQQQQKINTNDHTHEHTTHHHDHDHHHHSDQHHHTTFSNTKSDDNDNNHNTTTSVEQRWNQQLHNTIDPSVYSWNHSVATTFLLPDNDDDDGGGSVVTTTPQSQNRRRSDFTKRGYTVGIGGPVGSGKTATVLALCQSLPKLAQQIMLSSSSSSSAAAALSAVSANNHHSSTSSSSNGYTLELGVVTNDIFTQEDADYLQHHDALQEHSAHRIMAVETGGCPHTAIREDISSNIAALETITKRIQRDYNNNSTTNTTADVQMKSGIGQEPPVQPQPPNILLLCESGGDNLAANFSNELVDLSIYVIDVAGGDKIPRKGGPGITQSDLLIVNKIDLADAVGSNLHIMYRDATIMRTPKQRFPQSPQQQQVPPMFIKPLPPPGPTLFCAVKHNFGVEEIGRFILSHYFAATKPTTTTTKT